MKIDVSDLDILDNNNVEYRIWDPSVILRGESEVEIEFESMFKLNVARDLIKSVKEALDAR
jgi:hypothetical protein